MCNKGVFPRKRIKYDEASTQRIMECRWFYTRCHFMERCRTRVDLQWTAVTSTTIKVTNWATLEKQELMSDTMSELVVLKIEPRLENEQSSRVSIIESENSAHSNYHRYIVYRPSWLDFAWLESRTPTRAVYTSLRAAIHIGPIRTFEYRKSCCDK